MRYSLAAFAPDLILAPSAEGQNVCIWRHLSRITGKQFESYRVVVQAVKIWFWQEADGSLIEAGRFVEFSGRFSTNVRDVHPIKMFCVAKELAVFLLCHFTSLKLASTPADRSARSDFWRPNRVFSFFVFFFSARLPLRRINTSPASPFRSVILPSRHSTPHSPADV